MVEASCSPQVEVIDPVFAALQDGLLSERQSASATVESVLQALSKDGVAADEPLWILLDDFDTLIEFGAVTSIDELIARLPELRVVTVTASAGGLRAPSDDSWAIADGVERITAAELEFTYGEAEEAFRASAGDAHTADLDAATVSRMYASTRGLPLAVALAADRWVDPIVSRTEGFQVGFAMSAVCVESARTSPARTQPRVPRSRRIHVADAAFHGPRYPPPRSRGRCRGPSRTRCFTGTGSGPGPSSG